jgi:hypothetical protein
MNAQDEYAEAYRLTFEHYSLQAGARQNRANVALLVNGGLLALAGSFRESSVVMSPVGGLGLVSNLMFFLVLRRLRAPMDLLEAELRALEHYLPHVAHRLLAERLGWGPGPLRNSDLFRALQLPKPPKGYPRVLRGKLRNPWLPPWQLPLVGRLRGVRGLDQGFFFLLALLWPLFAVIAALLE